MTRWILLVITIIAVYLIVLVSFDPWDIAIGTVFAIVLTIAARRFLVAESLPSEPTSWRRVLALVPFSLAVASDILVGTWQVIKVTLGFQPLRSPGIVKVPIGERSSTGLAVTALVLTLSPGEFLVDVDWSERVMLIHALDASDPARIRAFHQRFYERYQRPIFP